jgi:hypothetical protein
MGVAWHPPAHQPSARGVHLLFLLHRDWASAANVFLPLHATGVLWSPAATPATTLTHSSGDLRPLS